VPVVRLAGLTQLMGNLPRMLLDRATIAGRPGWELHTPLIDVAFWQQESTEAVAAGAVSQATLGQLLATIK